MSHENVLARIDAELSNSTERLFELLRIASISTDPAYAGQCDAAADWLVEDLKSFGIRAEKHPSGGHPFVVGHSDSASEGDGEGENDGDHGPHYLFYGHYDVQPTDPIELWQRDPFDPQVEDSPGGKRIRARGASDDKGQLMTFVEACRAWTAEHGELPARITFFFEGEEESGSPSLRPFMRAHAAELSADLALICDTGLFGTSTPTIVTMLRGLLGQEIIITGADKDLHSGMFGGAAANPARILARIIAGLHDEAGRVSLPGFYDAVDEPDAGLLAQWQALGFDHRAFLGDVGLSQPAGEAGRSALEMLWSRPTCEVNGIIGGYTGDGFKTVLPARASAKISFRLVGRQDPVKIRAAFQKYVRAGLPVDCDVEFVDHGMAPAAHMQTSHPAFEAARGALSDEWPRAAAYTGCGGSIPIAGYFKEILDMDAMLIGFARDDDQIHSPNEKYDLECFHKGIRSWARILHAISRDAVRSPQKTAREA